MHFLGEVSRPADVLALTDIFVLPSVTEGLPLALLEAMGAGKPVVATAVGGVPEAVTSGVNGILVPPESATSLADGIEALARSPMTAQRYGAAALSTVAGGFLEEQYVGALSSLYVELVRNV